MSTGLSETGVRGLKSRQKTEGMSLFYLPDTPKLGSTVPKVEQNHQKLKKYSTRLPSLKTVWTQITGTSQKSPFCSQTNSDAVIEQMMRSTEFVKITVVYGHIDENGRFVRNWTARKMAITDKMVKNGRLSVKIQVFRTRFYGQNLQKAGFVRKSSS